MTRRGPLLAALAATVLVLAACDPDAPKPPNYSSVSPTPSATTGETPTTSAAAPNTTANVSPGNVAPTRPASASEQTSDGALAYSAYFWQMLDWAYATNDSSVLTGLYAASCKSCATFESSISTDVGSGYVLLGGRIAIQSVKAAGLEGGQVAADYAFDVSLKVDALQEKDEGGAVATSYPASSNTQRTYVSWAEGKWQVVNTAQVTG